jgi:hypothetical protein
VLRTVLSRVPRVLPNCPWRSVAQSPRENALSTFKQHHHNVSLWFRQSGCAGISKVENPGQTHKGMTAVVLASSYTFARGRSFLCPSKSQNPGLGVDGLLSFRGIQRETHLLPNQEMVGVS